MGGFLAREIGDADRQKLLAWQRSEDKIRFQRARIVLTAEKTANARVVADLVGVHVQTVRDVARVYRAEGLAGLEPKPRTGRPPKFGEAATDKLIELLHESHKEHGGDDGRWTLEVAAQALAKALGVEAVSVETVRLLLRRRKHSWQRAKEWLESPDPRYAFKKSGVLA